MLEISSGRLIAPTGNLLLQQIEYLANIVRTYRGEKTENTQNSIELLKEKFADGKYTDVLGLCKLVTLDEIKAQGWSLNPGRYVGVSASLPDDFNFKERFEELNEELVRLNAETHVLEEHIANNMVKILDVINNA